MNKWIWLRQYGVYLLQLYWERRSYRTALVLSTVSGVVGMAQFALMGVFLREGNTFPGIEQYGGDVVSYLLSGTIFTGFVAISLHSFSSTVQEEQMAGTLEAVADSPAGILRVMIFSAVTGFIGTVVGSILMMGLFSFLLGFDLNINVGAVIISLVLTLLALGGFGMAGCGVVLVTKKGDPITWTVLTAMTLLSGVLYPITVLPQWLQTVSHFLPTTTALDLVRSSLLNSASVTGTLSASLPLVGWAALSVPLGAALLRWGLLTSRRRGSLGQY
ncbi:ABC transporter permease [Nocardia sp. NPDC019395]|uniref:ABC transporter permease n=1 Tax=Nocardia sp. NPDC019395 TaxID=3154686 RepID=UPI0033EB94D1